MLDKYKYICYTDIVRLNFKQMSRPKTLNPMNERVLVRMDRNLRIQLEAYAKRNDNSLISVSARRAIKLFLQEASSFKENSTLPSVRPDGKV